MYFIALLTDFEFIFILEYTCNSDYAGRGLVTLKKH